VAFELGSNPFSIRHFSFFIFHFLSLYSCDLVDRIGLQEELIHEITRKRKSKKPNDK